MEPGRPARRSGQSGAALRSLLPGTQSDRRETAVEPPRCHCAPRCVHPRTDKRTKAATGEGPAAAPRVRVRRTLLAACGPVATGRGGLRARRPLRSRLRAPPPAAPSERDRDAPSHPAVLTRAARRTHAGRPPSTQWLETPLVSVRLWAPPGSSFSRTLRAVAPSRPGDTNEQLRNGAGQPPLVRSFRLGYSVRHRWPTVAARAPGGRTGRRARRARRLPGAAAPPPSALRLAPRRGNPSEAGAGRCARRRTTGRLPG